MWCIDLLQAILDKAKVYVIRCNNQCGRQGKAGQRHGERGCAGSSAARGDDDVGAAAAAAAALHAIPAAFLAQPHPSPSQEMDRLRLPSLTWSVQTPTERHR